jgi:hypothetical protein
MKNGKMKYILSKETFQYIPILQTLEAILNHPDIITEVCIQNASLLSLHVFIGIFRYFM